VRPLRREAGHLDGDLLRFLERRGWWRGGACEPRSPRVPRLSRLVLGGTAVGPRRLDREPPAGSTRLRSCGCLGGGLGEAAPWKRRPAYRPPAAVAARGVRVVPRGRSSPIVDRTAAGVAGTARIRPPPRSSTSLAASSSSELELVGLDRARDAPGTGRRGAEGELHGGDALVAGERDLARARRLTALSAPRCPPWQPSSCEKAGMRNLD